MVNQAMRLPRKRPGRVRIRSADPGVRNPGNVVVDVWWDADAVRDWTSRYRKRKRTPVKECPYPQFQLQLLLGDAMIPASVTNVFRFGPVKCILAQEQFLRVHADALIRSDPDWIAIETQDGKGKRLIGKVAATLFTHSLHAGALFPGFCQQTQVTFVPATWKTEMLNIPPGRQNYTKRKKASVAEVQRLLKERGMGDTAAILLEHESVRDVSDALLQALRFFVHQYPPNLWNATDHAAGPVQKKKKSSHRRHRPRRRREAREAREPKKRKRVSQPEEPTSVPRLATPRMPSPPSPLSSPGTPSMALVVSAAVPEHLRVIVARGQRLLGASLVGTVLLDRLP